LVQAGGSVQHRHGGAEGHGELRVDHGLALGS
jgi:hypothetical protein